MIFVYLRDGQRLEVPDAVSVIHRREIVFLNRDGEIIRQLPNDDILAYSRVLYNETDSVVEPVEARFSRPITPLYSGDSVMTPRRRHRRWSRKAEAGTEAASS